MQFHKICQVFAGIHFLLCVCAHFVVTPFLLLLLLHPPEPLRRLVTMAGPRTTRTSAGILLGLQRSQALLGPWMGLTSRCRPWGLHAVLFQVGLWNFPWLQEGQVVSDLLLAQGAWLPGFLRQAAGQTCTHRPPGRAAWETVVMAESQ